MSIEIALQTNERIAEFIDKLDCIATLPEVTARITAIVNDPKSSAGDLHRIISHDPALVTRILKLANSSLYARRNRIDSVERAIVMLGFDAVHNLAVTATIGQIFGHVDLCNDYSARDLWTHCVAVAAASRAIAGRFCKPLAEPAFLAGLIHDVGLLVELQLCPDDLRRLCAAAQSSTTPFTALELEIIGCNHAELGAALAQRWGFPEFCRAAAAYHHHPSLAETDQAEIAAIVYAADTLCCEDAIGFDLTAKTQVAETVGFESLVPLGVIEDIRGNLPAVVSDAILVFGE
jgi:HD-like signal output (HDOD) protein